MIKDKNELIEILKNNSFETLEYYRKIADDIRKEKIGDKVELRGLIEISNYCSRKCAYCGLRAPRKDINRYRMSIDEILECAQKSRELGFKTIVVQAGEDYNLTKDFITEMIEKVKQKTDVAITLSLGERSYEELKAWKKAGADRYLLRFETSNKELFEKIHPPQTPTTKRLRFQILKELKELGYETGSGVMVGIPEQTYQDLANDIFAFRDLGLHMIGLGPYLPHPDTPLGKLEKTKSTKQVPNTVEMTCLVLCLTRILCPETNIPSTTAISTIDTKEGRQQGLLSGANVLMPNITPLKYRNLYEIYPQKAGIGETAEESFHKIKKAVSSINREVSQTKGFSPKFIKENN